MGLNGIQYFVENMSFQQQANTNKISKQDFEDFCKGFVFEQLRGLKFGKQFCSKYNIYDLLILYESSCTDKIKKYIMKNYTT
jgi:hypothetical protein